MSNNTLIQWRDSNGLRKAEVACPRHLVHTLQNLGETDSTKQVGHLPCDACEFDERADANDQRLVDAGVIARAMKDVPEERRLDAVATAVDAFCQTGGRLR
jgi:hypothetical protein